MLVSDRPSSQDTPACATVKAERTAAIARMKRILVVEEVGWNGSVEIVWLKRSVEKIGRKGWLKRLVERLLDLKKTFRGLLLYISIHRALRRIHASCIGIAILTAIHRTLRRNHASCVGITILIATPQRVSSLDTI